ncbi:MAG: hypothetical protein HOP25_01070 [Methylotenera sp.]|nr:hypothetical protein [Methylotenera sp.]
MSYKAIINGYEEYKELRSGAGTITDEGRKINFCNSHILAEGDSWFHFNLLGVQENLLQSIEFSKPTAIANMALSGDDVSQMMDGSIKGFFNKSRVKHFKAAIAYQQWDMFLLSAGGNDLINAFDGGYKVSDTETVQIIKKKDENSNGLSHLDYIDEKALKQALAHIKECFAQIIAMLRHDSRHSQTPIIAHTYDYFTLRHCKNKKDKSIRQKALENCNVPKTYWKLITELMNDQLAQTLLTFNDDGTYPNVRVINTLSTLTQADQDVEGNTKHWRNEIHPNKTGYNKLAKDRINQYL